MGSGRRGIKGCRAAGLGSRIMALKNKSWKSVHTIRFFVILAFAIRPCAARASRSTTFENKNDPKLDFFFVVVWSFRPTKASTGDQYNRDPSYTQKPMYPIVFSELLGLDYYVPSYDYPRRPCDHFVRTAEHSC